MKTWGVLVLLLLLVPCSARATNSSVFIASGSQTDQPAQPGQASSEADAAARYLSDRIAIEIQNRFPCATATVDRDIAALTELARQRSILDPSYEPDLASIAGGLGAGHVVSVTVIQTGGRMTMQATCIDTNTARATERADRQTTPNGAADGAEALARDFVDRLGPIMAVKPQPGKSYPARSVFPATATRTYANHAFQRDMMTQAEKWDPSPGLWGRTSSLHCGPQGWGDCGGCADCTCAANCYLQLNSPGRYRVVNVSGGIQRSDRKVEVLYEVTIEGSCK